MHECMRSAMNLDACVTVHFYFENTCISRLTEVSHVAKQSRTGDTTVCYIHERSILIERSPKADCKNQPYEKTTRDTKSAYNH